MKISKDELKYIAELSKLQFEEQALDKLEEDFSKILEHFKVINTLDFSDVSLDIQKGGLSVLREDACIPFEDREHLLDNAFEKEGTYIKVPKVLD